MDRKIEVLHNLLKELEAAEEAATKADEAWEQDPASEEKEKAFDEAYKTEWKAFRAALINLMGFGIDEATAALMIKTKRDDLIYILSSRK